MLAVSEILGGFDAQVYINALVAVAQADGVKDAEREFILTQASALGISDVDFAKPIELAEVVGSASKSTLRIILRDCIAVALADGDYSPAERARIRRIAEVLGVDPAIVDPLEAWVRAYSDILEQGQALLAGE